MRFMANSNHVKNSFSHKFQYIVSCSMFCAKNFHINFVVILILLEIIQYNSKYEILWNIFLRRNDVIGLPFRFWTGFGAKVSKFGRV